MTRLLCAIATALTLALASTAACAQEVQRVQSALDALRETAAALDRNDAGKATDVLAGMKNSVEALHGTFEVFRGHADIAAKQRETELLAVNRQVTTTFQAQEAAEAQLRDLPDRIKILEQQHASLQSTKIQLDAQMESFREEVNFRKECKSRFMDGIWWSTRCTSLGWADLTGGRVSHLNSDIQRNTLERGRVDSELGPLRGQLGNANAALGQALRDKPRLEAERAQLKIKEDGLRAAVVALNDAALFWADMLILVDSRLGSPVGELQDKAGRLIRRAQEAGNAPAFSSYDVKKIATLQDTLIEFARTLDNRSNILLLPENGGPPRR